MSELSAFTHAGDGRGYLLQPLDAAERAGRSGRSAPGRTWPCWRPGTPRAFEKVPEGRRQGRDGPPLRGPPEGRPTARVEVDAFFLKGIRLVTSYSAGEKETAAALELLANGRISVSEMITHRFPLGEAQPCVRDARGQQQCMKALILD